MAAASAVPHDPKPTVWAVHPLAGAAHPHVVTDLGRWYGGMRPNREERPWTALNMITSIDGSVTVDGLSGSLGNSTDRRILGALRSAASLILVGAGTAASEGYGPPRKAGQRVGVVTNSGRLDPHAELFASGAGFAVTHHGASLPSGVEALRSGVGHVDLELALGQLATMAPNLDAPGSWVVVEGGPTLNGALIGMDLIDEINLTTAPIIAGGDGKRATAGAPEVPLAYELAHQLIDSDHYVFSRWVRRDRADRRLS